MKYAICFFFKNSKPETLPPTRDLLNQNLKRASYQSIIWKNADCALPNVPPVTDCGWKIPILMEREGVLDLGLTVVYCKYKTGCTVNSKCSCRRGNLLCT